MAQRPVEDIGLVLQLFELVVAGDVAVEFFHRALHRGASVGKGIAATRFGVMRDVIGFGFHGALLDVDGGDTRMNALVAREAKLFVATLAIFFQAMR